MIIPLEEFESMYLNIINDKRFIQNIIDQGSFNEWIQTTVLDNVQVHYDTMLILKEKLIEHEFYEQIKAVDELIKDLKTKLNDQTI